jgi:hypothetical protein
MNDRHFDPPEKVFFTHTKGLGERQPLFANRLTEADGSYDDETIRRTTAWKELLMRGLG